MNIPAKWTLIAIVFLTAWPLFASEWYEDYERAKSRVKKGDCGEATELMLSALEKNPKPDNKARPYGTHIIEYIPYFYLAQCAHDTGDMKTAMKYIKEAAKFGIAQSSRSKDFDELKANIEAGLRAVSEGLAVVVNPGNRTSTLTSGELKDLFLGTKQQWADGTPVTPVLLSQGSKINEIFLNKVCGMDENSYVAYWEKLNQADTSRPMPIFIEQDDWLVRYISRNPGAIGFVDPEQARELKVITVDGKSEIQ